jgi:hypothetical protein
VHCENENLSDASTTADGKYFRMAGFAQKIGLWEASPTPIAFCFEKSLRLIEVGDLSHDFLGKALPIAIA